MNARPLPELRYREGAKDEEFTQPVVIQGTVIGTDLETVRIEGARARVTELYVADLEPVLGGPDMTLGILIDASDHRDRVTIALTRERITYDNPAQSERFKAPAAP